MGENAIGKHENKSTVDGQGNFDLTRTKTCRSLAAAGIATRTKVAYQWWTEQDRPDRQQFHLTVTRERQSVWLDDPANTVTSLA